MTGKFGAEFPYQVFIPESGRTLVYALVNPVTDEVFYVGVSDNPVVRYTTHCRKGTENTVLAKRIQSIEARGLKPELWVLAEYEDREQALVVENLFIQQLGQQECCANRNLRSYGDPRDVDLGQLWRMWQKKEFKNLVAVKRLATAT